MGSSLGRRHKGEHDRGSIYIEGVHAVGVLNYENATLSGERRFLARFFEQFREAPVLDVGVNKGQYSELVRELAPKAVMPAFEPHPVSFAAPLGDGIMTIQDYDPTFMEVFAYQNMVCIQRDLESSWIHSSSSGGGL
jgi:hypothetical protein